MAIDTPTFPDSFRTQIQSCRRVLLADDDPFVLRLFSRTLERAGYEVDVASEGAEAARYLLERSYCAAVLDVAMPGMNGIEVLRCVRVHDLDVPVLLVTGAADVQTAAEAVSHGAFQLLMKPVATKLLVGEVERARHLHDLAVTRRHAMRLLEIDQAEASRLAAIDASLDRAMESLWMAYQPIVRPDGSVFGYEALMRTGEPTLPGPLAVLDAAEKVGRMRQLAKLTRDGAAHGFEIAPRNATLFVNLSARDVLDDDLLLRDAPLSRIANRVVLEITERASLHDIRDLKSRIADLRQAGFRIAIDDLGAGYAGLTSFTLLEPEFVKIDLSLVRDVHLSPTKRRLVRLLCATCREMNVTVVAEGIECLEERDALVDMGADLLQGYAFGKPGKLALAS